MEILPNQKHIAKLIYNHLVVEKKFKETSPIRRMIMLLMCSHKVSQQEMIPLGTVFLKSGELLRFLDGCSLYSGVAEFVYFGH